MTQEKIVRENNSIIPFIRQKDYQMINNNIGRGSFGKTVLLKDESIDELFVCKKYEPYYEEDTETFFEAFKKEIKIMYKLNHKNIVRIYNYYLYDKELTGYIIMEYVQGRDIDTYFKEHVESLDVNNIFIQLLDAFKCLEDNKIIHRDIRYSNIMIDDNGNVKVIDFGLGKVYSSKGMSADSLYKEINRLDMELEPNELSRGIYTLKTDMFCLAELFNRLIKKYSIKDFKYESILNKMMKVNPNERYDSIQEILDIINNRQFSLLNISYHDKQIYSSFVNSLYDAIESFTQKVEIETNPEKILLTLKDVIERNCFEDSIVDIRNLLDCFIKCEYRYHPYSVIMLDEVIAFYKWIQNKPENYQMVVIRNIKTKLQTITVRESNNYEDLPF